MRQKLTQYLATLSVGFGILVQSADAAAASRNPGTELLETIGISVAVGAALGASTLSFYDRPAEHWANILYGAAAGGAVGMGILVHGMFDGNDSALTQRLGPGQRQGGPRSFPIPKSPTVTVPLVSVQW
ncbi:MAG: hypothetical protein JNL01_00080 [Bdellovibrionales bacterium]|nr:hypothetical protein [Bdellovibrionales bacterium]